ncbi:endolytic transglycosylase MltG [Neobacillus muris]|uniref:endolytic transglycosylase MltG n=1 Tax=Neobacillus muris TaxID=2941334 RepID=UPI00203ECB97|nr:endolytic transglycosylase MltG [Neobacillus muris]
MKINIVSSFAAGIFIATGILGTVYLTGDHKVSKSTSKSTQKVELSEKEMVDKLTAAGYTIQPKAEPKESADAQPAQPDAPAQASTQPPTQVVVNVTAGMGSIDVGRILRDGKLIEDAFQFASDIEQRGLVNKLREGTYTVDSNMSYDQIISTIYGN